MAKLIIFDDSVRGVDLPDRAVIVGRSLKADIPIHDRLLSRKHCSLLREGNGYRLLDLKSANGTFVNGVRVDKADLEYDDVIEVGHTVMVLLESDTWERGEGLAKLRNPLKAQELTQRIRLGAQRRADGREPRAVDGAAHAGIAGRPGPAREGESASRGERDPLGPDGLPWTGDLVRELGLTSEFLEGFVLNRVASLLVRRTPELRECLSDAMDRVLTPESFEGGFERFRSLLREAIHDSLREAGLSSTGRTASDTGRRNEARAATELAPDDADTPEPTPREEPRVLTDQTSSPAEDERLEA